MIGFLPIDNFGGDADLQRSIAKLGYRDTPLLNLIAKGMPSASAEIDQGHSWKYEQVPDGSASNSHLIGSAPADVEHHPLGSSANHYQIFKDDYGVPGSSLDKRRTDGKSLLENQGALASIKHRKTLEMAFFSDAIPVKPVEGTTAGVMGGLKHWGGAVGNFIDANADLAADLTMKDIKDLLKIGWRNGVNTTHIFMNEDQKDRLDTLLENKIHANIGARALAGENFMLLKNFVYAPNDVKVILSPYVASDEIIALNLPSLGFVNNRLTFTRDIPSGNDAKQKEILTEATLRVNNPFGVTMIKNLAV